MKLLNGKELADFIKARQEKQVRSLVGRGNNPKLAIVQMKDDPVIETYIKLKQSYGDDIGVEVEHHKINQSQALETISILNNDETVDGIIVQLPIADTNEQQQILDSVALHKDVDGLSTDSPFDAATPTAIMWLLAGFNVEIRGKNIVLVGKGALVGKPLERMLVASGHKPTIVDRNTQDIESIISSGDIIITATGSPALIKSDMIKHGAVVVDAGVAVEAGVARGDVQPDVYERDDLTITPVKGGVGPLTVTALFDNLLRAAEANLSSRQAAS